MKLLLKDIKTTSPRVRQSQDPEELDVLAASIGALNQAIIPVGVRKNGEGWNLVYGHRRVAAAKQAGLKEIEAIEVEAPDDFLKVYGLVENVVREGMTALDIAKALQQIKNESGWTAERVGKFFGRPESWVRQHIDLLDYQKPIARSDFGVGHLREVKAGLGKEHQDQVAAVVKKVVGEGLSTRQTRDIARAMGVALDHGDTARAKEIVGRPYKDTAKELDDEPLRQEARTRIIERQKVKRPIAWETVPEVARLLKTIRAWKNVVPDFDVAIRVGKLSPEGKRFAAEKIKELVREVRSFLKSLEELQRKLEE